jgi:glycine cleavage system aminomethyltransferase T
MTHDPYAFMSPAAATAAGPHRPLLRSPIEHAHLAAGATILEQDGWRVAAYAGERGAAWLADLSHLGKLDLRAGGAELDELTGGLQPGRAREAGELWLARLTATHGYVLCPFGSVAATRQRIGPAAIDVTCGLACLALGGPAWREVWMRSSGIDARERSFPAGACLAGSVMRVPTLVINQGPLVLMLVGWEFGEYFWEAILDAGETIGITPVSVAAAAPVEATV